MSVLVTYGPSTSPEAGGRSETPITPRPRVGSYVTDCLLLLLVRVNTTTSDTSKSPFKSFIFTTGSRTR